MKVVFVTSFNVDHQQFYGLIKIIDFVPSKLKYKKLSDFL